MFRTHMVVETGLLDVAPADRANDFRRAGLRSFDVIHATGATSGIAFTIPFQKHAAAFAQRAVQHHIGHITHFCLPLK